MVLIAKLTTANSNSSDTLKSIFATRKEIQKKKVKPVLLGLKQNSKMSANISAGGTTARWRPKDVDEREYSPSRFNHLLCDIVEKIPAAKGEGGLQEGQGDLAHRRRPVQGEGHVRSQRLVVP